MEEPDLLVLLPGSPRCLEEDLPPGLLAGLERPQDVHRGISPPWFGSPATQLRRMKLPRELSSTRCPEAPVRPLTRRECQLVRAEDLRSNLELRLRSFRPYRRLLVFISRLHCRRRWGRGFGRRGLLRRHGRAFSFWRLGGSGFLRLGGLGRRLCSCLQLLRA